MDFLTYFYIVIFFFIYFFRYLKEFRVEQCPNFLLHKCNQVIVEATNLIQIDFCLFLRLVLHWYVIVFSTALTFVLIGIFKISAADVAFVVEMGHLITALIIIAQNMMKPQEYVQTETSKFSVHFLKNTKKCTIVFNLSLCLFGTFLFD